MILLAVDWALVLEKTLFIGFIISISLVVAMYATYGERKIAAFIQDRAHVFNGHFGSETFSYSIGDSTEVNGWKPANREKPFENAYKFIVTQDYTGKYGKFSFSQHVYVVKYKKELVILWDYNK